MSVYLWVMGGVSGCRGWLDSVPLLLVLGALDIGGVFLGVRGGACWFFFGFGRFWGWRFAFRIYFWFCVFAFIFGKVFICVFIFVFWGWLVAFFEGFLFWWRCGCEC
ncbi:MAG: hypothetical protein QXN15_11790 [Candidatus Jordarchaeales archaeon]